MRNTSGVSLLALAAMLGTGWLGAVSAQQGPSFRDERRLPGSDNKGNGAAAAEQEARQKAEDDARRAAAEADAKRKADDAARKLAAEADAKRKAEEDARRLAAETEAKRKADEETRRLAAEAEAKRKADEEARRLTAEAEAKRKADEEARRLAAEAEAKRRADEQARRLAAEAEAKRKADEEARRLAAEAEAKRRTEETARRQEQERRVATELEARRKALGIVGSPEDAQRFLIKGRQLLRDGDIASGRLFLERSAEAGSADAAIELAQSFDPAVIPTLGAFGLVADVEQAKTWYRRAQQLGATTVGDRLQRLGGT